MTKRRFPGLIAGRIVQYVFSEGDQAGEACPALIVAAQERRAVEGSKTLLVFLEGENADPNTTTRMHWAADVPYSAEKTPGTWHWRKQEE